MAGTRARGQNTPDPGASDRGSARNDLLNNSCKYSGPETRIWLTAERQGNDVAVTVRDAGIGIPPDLLPRVFDLFTQVDRSLEHSAGGLGIGLSLVKRLVEMHGGTVTAHSDGQGRGSKFVVRLPILTASATPCRSRPATVPRL